ncbi:MAG: hypothetical protein ACE5KT_08990 [Methanosarcinales archaeon]
MNLKNLLIVSILCMFIGTASAELTISAPECVELGESIANTSIVIYDNGTPVRDATVMYSLESGTSFGPFYTDANGHPSQGFTPDSLGVLTIVAGVNGNVAQTEVTIATSCNQTIGNCTDNDGDGVPDAWDKCQDTPKGSYVNSTGCHVLRGDFNHNGRIDIGDVTKLAYYLVGKIDSLDK